MNNIAVIFDLDGVLVDSNPYHKQTWKKFCERHDIEITDELLEKEVFGRTGDESLPILFNKPLHREELTAYNEEIDGMFRQYFVQELQPVKGLVDFLENLKQENIPVAVATSAPPENIVAVMAQTGLGRYFDTIVDKTQITKGKPNPEIYLKAAALINMQPKDCIVIEDSLAGVQAGLAAGMKVIGVTTTHTPEELNHTNLVINDFTELTAARLREI